MMDTRGFEQFAKAQIAKRQKDAERRNEQRRQRLRREKRAAYPDLSPEEIEVIVRAMVA